MIKLNKNFKKTLVSNVTSRTKPEKAPKRILDMIENLADYYEVEVTDLKSILESLSLGDPKDVEFMSKLKASLKSK